MTVVHLLLLALGVLGLVARAHRLSARAPRELGVLGATVIDGTGAPAVPDAVILIENRPIRAVGPRTRTAIPKGPAALLKRSEEIGTIQVGKRADLARLEAIHGGKSATSEMSAWLFARDEFLRDVPLNTRLEIAKSLARKDPAWGWRHE